MLLVLFGLDLLQVHYTHVVVCCFEADIEILLKEPYELGLYMGAQIWIVLLALSIWTDN